MANSQDHVKAVAKYALWGEWAVNLALLLFASLVLWTLINILLGLPGPIPELIDALELSDTTQTLTTGQAFIAAAFYFAMDILGIAMLLTARKLFIGFRRTGILTSQAASDLRRIGLIILALAPVSILSILLGNFILTLWITGSNISINLTLDDTDIYAIIIGLVITAVSQIMHEALRIDEENRAFI